MNVSVAVAVLTDVPSQDGRVSIGASIRDAAVAAARAAGAIVALAEASTISVPTAFLNAVLTEKAHVAGALSARVVHRVDFAHSWVTMEQLGRFADALAADTILRRSQAAGHFDSGTLAALKALADGEISALRSEGALLAFPDPAIDSLLADVRRALSQRP